MLVCGRLRVGVRLGWAVGMVDREEVLEGEGDGDGEGILGVVIEGGGGFCVKLAL